jgi:predicted transposase YdaD
MREDKDRSSKWVVEHRGDSLLRLAGIHGFSRWQPAPSQLIQPLESPDGVLEVFFPGRAEPDLVVVEVATYPERRANEQMQRDDMAVVLARRLMPEVVTLVLCPKGQLRLTGAHTWTSRLGGTAMTLSWRVVELWTLSAADLLATGDVGLVPLVPLTQLTEPPEVVFQECRRRIDQAPEEERANMLAVTQVMAQLRYNDSNLLAILGGRQTMIESPLIQEIIDETRHENTRTNITSILQDRFGALPAEVSAALAAVQDMQRLNELLRVAYRCADLAAFQAQLAAGGQSSEGEGS